MKDYFKNLWKNIKDNPFISVLGAICSILLAFIIFLSCFFAFKTDKPITANASAEENNANFQNLDLSGAVETDNKLSFPAGWYSWKDEIDFSVYTETHNVLTFTFYPNVAFYTFQGGMTSFAFDNIRFINFELGRYYLQTTSKAIFYSGGSFVPMAKLFFADKAFEYNFDATTLSGEQATFLQHNLVYLSDTDGIFKDLYEYGEYDGFNNGYAEGFDKGSYDGYENGRADGYKAGYQTGKEEGEKNGYDTGYTNGLNMGQTLQLQNPMGYFFDSVQTFLDIKLFGVISVGDVLSVGIFVAVAVIFLKMFAGG